MFSKINYQYLFSYLGLIPFIFIIFDKFFLFYLDNEFVKKFIIYYCLIIIVFIGGINWNLEEKISNLKAVYGFISSLFAVFLIILNLFEYKINYLIILLVLFLILQLLFDYIFIYQGKNSKKPFYLLRLPLSFGIIFCLIVIKY